MKDKTCIQIIAVVGSVVISCASTNPTLSSSSNIANTLSPPEQMSTSLSADKTNVRVDVHKFDLNHDGIPDAWAYYEKPLHSANSNYTLGILVHKDWDVNFDGNVDLMRYFNREGEIIKEFCDLNFDGRMDITTYFQKGYKFRQDYDFNYDNKPDYWKFFQNNVLIRTARDCDFDGQIDRWEYFTNGKRDRNR
jgi:hypothetical protein